MVRGKVKLVNGKYRSSLESSYANILDGLKRTGMIYDWRYEPFKIRLADNTTYTPDFMVITTEGIVELHETKGFMRDDANVKLKVAAEMYPWFTFKLIKKVRGDWDVKIVSNGKDNS